ncbi:unnamed protein product [Sphenostylis stenocarpa]|uniref:Uncharacterized protein n=1 Tax=Sphenostylis stenocarpa TaxID=92480 RepID=A0AA86VS39_9FABA|nr:unnamed protein product [Sphenostylis stenocarpa]
MMLQRKTVTETPTLASRIHFSTFTLLSFQHSPASRSCFPFLLNSALSSQFSPIESPSEIPRSEIPKIKRPNLWCVRGSLPKDVLWGESLHALRVLDSCGDYHRDALRVRSVQAWVPQDQRHCQLLRFLRRLRRKKALPRICTTAIVLVHPSLVLFRSC